LHFGFESGRKIFGFGVDLYCPIVQLIVCIITYSLLKCFIKCSGATLIIYQLSVYPSIERACGAVGIARITGVSFHQIVAIISFLTFQFFCYLKFFHMQMLSIPLLQSYPLIALLSGVALTIVIVIASILKNILSVSAPLCLFNCLSVILSVQIDSEKFCMLQI